MAARVRRLTITGRCPPHSQPEWAQFAFEREWRKNLAAKRAISLRSYRTLSLAAFRLPDVNEFICDGLLRQSAHVGTLCLVLASAGWEPHA